MDKGQIQEKLSKELKKKRFEHSMGVCKEAVKMAEIFDANTDKAYFAGLLHDCAKCLKPEEETAICEKYGFVPDEITTECHPVLHAPLGALVAKYEYGIDDEEILDAIRYHTVGRADMTLLDKIVYVADVTEPGRDYDGVEVLRGLAYKNIDEAFAEAVKQALQHNIKKQTIIHPGTIDAWNFIIRKINK